jgi:hypothetical protein
MAQQPLIIGELAEPAVNTEIDLTMGSDGPYLCKSISFNLAAVGGTGRLVEITFETSTGKVFHRVVTTATILAGNTGNVIAASGIANEDVGTDYRYCKLPDSFVIPSGTVIKTIRSDDQSGDQYSAVEVFGFARYFEAV